MTWEKWPEGDGVLQNDRYHGKERVPGKTVMSHLLNFGFLDSSRERRQCVKTHVGICEFLSPLKVWENKAPLPVWIQGRGRQRRKIRTKPRHSALLPHSSAKKAHDTEGHTQGAVKGSNVRPQGTPDLPRVITPQVTHFHHLLPFGGATVSECFGAASWPRSMDQKAATRDGWPTCSQTQSQEAAQMKFYFRAAKSEISSAVDFRNANTS